MAPCGIDTVDARIPTAVGRWFIPLFIDFQPAFRLIGFRTRPVLMIICPLVVTNIAIEAMAIEMASFPIQHADVPFCFCLFTSSIVSFPMKNADVPHLFVNV